MHIPKAISKKVTEEDSEQYNDAYTIGEWDIDRPV